MWNEPTEKQLSAIPKLYSTEDVPIANKVIHMHFFIGGSDWWVAEYDPEQRLFFGYARINGDDEMAEWGYVSLDELKSAKQGPIEIDRDLHWTPKPFKEVHP